LPPTSAIALTTVGGWRHHRALSQHRPLCGLLEANGPFDGIVAVGPPGFPGSPGRQRLRIPFHPPAAVEACRSKYLRASASAPQG